MKGTYNTEVADVLAQLESQGLGKRVEICEGLFGISKGSDPEVVLTSCYHANEIYATYQSLLRLASTTQEPCIIIPVVDSARFETYKEESERNVVLHDSYRAGFLYDAIKGMYERPEVMPWQFDMEDACKEVKGLSRIIEGSKMVIDLHNSCINGYSLIYSPTNRTIEEEFTRKAIAELESGEKLYDGHIGNNHKIVRKGLFQCNIPNTVISFASSRGIMNLVVEIPAFKDNEPADFVHAEEFMGYYLDFLLKEYHKLRRGEDGDK